MYIYIYVHADRGLEDVYTYLYIYIYIYIYVYVHIAKPRLPKQRQLSMAGALAALSEDPMAFERLPRSPICSLRTIPLTTTTIIVVGCHYRPSAEITGSLKHTHTHIYVHICVYIYIHTDYGER